MSSGTTAEPIQPDAPVTNTRMRNLPMSVAVISLACNDSHWHHVPSCHGSMGTGRTRSAGEGSYDALRRAGVRADHGRGDRRAGRTDRADVLPAFRRQARSPVLWHGAAPGPPGP